MTGAGPEVQALFGHDVRSSTRLLLAGFSSGIESKGRNHVRQSSQNRATGSSLHLT